LVGGLMSLLGCNKYDITINLTEKTLKTGTGTERIYCIDNGNACYSKDEAVEYFRRMLK
jgi:hypothetical protein